MIDARARVFLQDLVRREGRSLLQYVSESFPWTTPEEKQALAPLYDMAREETEAVAALARFLTRNRIVPAPFGPYPMAFTNINYISLDHLLPLLMENQKQRIAELEAGAAVLTDAECRLKVDAYSAMKRRHLRNLGEMLQGLAKTTPVPT